MWIREEGGALKIIIGGMALAHAIREAGNGLC
jgi:hypothetical protein